MIELLAAGLIAIIIFMALLWLVSLALKNSSIVDIFWGPGFALAAWYQRPTGRIFHSTCYKPALPAFG